MAQTEINLTIENFRFSSQRWIVPSGEEIHFHIENPTGNPHNIIILKGQSIEELDVKIEENQYWSILIEQNEVEATFQAPAMPGEYRVVCSVDDHLEKGELGGLVVVIP
jgi:plastocyanin